MLTSPLAYRKSTHWVLFYVILAEPPNIFAD
jgi:hypothetical protein